ncbi:hypothetical protein IV500_20685 [Paeniglutamicibacter antarcticus]|uniref:MmyB-like transcription regulator ligand binding domain-containing protein n=1 Tax=Arthrobacter terrae TaxID=2935737 RepID=A0A931G7I2_9MICC|nr:hypothetical protein [Arthrobacter terrae]
MGRKSQLPPSQHSAQHGTRSFKTRRWNGSSVNWSVASEDFPRLWAGSGLFKHGHGAKRIFHPAVGTMTLNYGTMDIPESGRQFISAYTADAGSASMRSCGSYSAGTRKMRERLRRPMMPHRTR